jgi:hypothetical protein
LKVKTRPSVDEMIDARIIQGTCESTRQAMGSVMGVWNNK